MSHFSVEQLGEGQLVEAGALLQLAGVESVPEWWENEAEELIRRGGGVLVARGVDRSIYGLATYEVVKRGRAGRALAVGRLVSFELSGKQPAKHALVQALDGIAAAFQCSAIALPLPARLSARLGSNTIGRGADIFT